MSRVALSDVAFYGKASGVEDFTWDRRVPASVADWAPRLLQIHIDTRCPASAFLLRLDDGWWLMKGIQMPGVDAAGRPADALGVGRIASPVVRGAAGRLLPSAYRSWGPVRFATGSEIELGAADPPRPEETTAATLQLVVGARRWAAVTEPGSADAVAEALPVLGFVALLPRRWPTGWTLCPALVVERPAEPAEPRVAQLTARLPADPASLRLSELYTAASDPESRYALLSAALDGKIGETASITPEGWAWLLATARTLALTRAGASQVRGWLRAGILSPGDLRALGDRLTPSDAPSVADALAGHTEDLDWFVQCFGRGAPGVERILSPEALLALAALRTGTWSDDAVRHLPPLEKSGLLETLPAALLATLNRPELARVYEGALARAGVPATLAAALVRRSTLPGPPAERPAPGLDPAILPDASEFGPALCVDRAWRAWWVDVLRVQRPTLEVNTPTAPWSAAGEVWLAAAVADGEVSEAEALRRVARWRVSAPGRSVRDLLDAMGIRGGSALEAILGLGDPRPTTDAERDALARLWRAEVVSPDEIVRVGVATEDHALLRSVVVDGGSLALVDEAQSPPTSPPPGWDPRLLPLLAECSRRERFWSRWRGGLDAPMARWLAETLSAGRGGSDAAHVAAMFEGVVRPDPEMVLRVSAALPSELVLGLVVVLAGAWDLRGRSVAVGALLASATLRDDVRRWLRARLLTLDVCVPPALTARELRVLLPLLDPIEDVVRVLFARTVVDPEEEQLDAGLLGLLGRGARVPPPAPDAAAALRRGRLAALLAALPGWEHWNTHHEST